MKKKDLERRYNYLLLQLKIINQIATEMPIDKYEIAEAKAAIIYYSKKEIIKSNIDFIETYEEKYNFYNKTMSADDYIEALNNK